MNQATPSQTFITLLQNNKPQAMAWVTGNAEAPQLSGLVKFYETPFAGVLVEAEIFGLPDVALPGSANYYAMHIHEYGDCNLPSFSQSGGHYNPTGALHPQHAGDLPPLLGNQGYAWTSFYDKRYSIQDILNRSVIIHQKRDDFTTQPSGDSGDKIGCGVIRPL